MARRRSTANILRALALVTEFGLSVVMPIVLTVLLGVWLCGRFSIGPWLIVLSRLVGLVSGGCGFYRFARIFIRMCEETPAREEYRGGRR